MNQLNALSPSTDHRRTRLGRVLRVACVAAGVAVALGAVTSAQSPAAAKHRVYGVKDCVKPQVEPERIIFTCADAGIYANNILWRSWGGPETRASSAILHAPNAAGQSTQYYAKLTLHKVKTRNCNGKRGRYYTRIRLKFPRQAPPYASRIPTKMACV